METIEYIPVGLMFGLALGLGLLFTLLGVLIGPRGKSANKVMPFESGMPSQGSEFKRYNVRFYMIALSFLVFDVEIIFFYPWAVAFRELGWHGFIAMSVFATLLIIGLLYDWRKGILEWQ